MKLTSTEAIETIKSPQSKKAIDSVRNQESQLRVFTETLDENELVSETYWGSLKETMKTRSPQKFDRVFSFARYPLPVAQLCDSILSDFHKVFEGKNRHFNIDGDRDLTLLKKWVIDHALENWIEQHAKNVFKNKPCSFVVVDQDEDRKPYLIFVDSNRLIDAKFKNDKGQLEYITFIHSQTEEATRFACYDDQKYYVFEKKRDSETYTTISEVTHQIGYCPATAFISQPTNNKNLFKRRVAFSNALSKLEDWTVFDIFRNYVDHYAPFPVTEAPMRKCANPDCVNGAVTTDIIDNPAEPDNVRQSTKKCPVCDGADAGQHIFPGTHIGIQVKQSKDLQDGSGIFKMHFPDVENLKYVPEKLDDIEVEVRWKTVGVNQMESTNEAMNALQVKGSFSSMDQVLMRTKAELDHIYKWIVGTAGLCFYKDVYLKIDANFGTEWYLITEEDLQTRFDNAKKYGLPQSELVMIYEQLIETKYKGNPNKIDRQKLLLALDPMPIYTTDEVNELASKNLVNPETLSIKINFISFVARFEREYGPITQFGIKLEPQKRIEKIKEELEFYNAEAMAKITKLPPATEPKTV